MLYQEEHLCSCACWFWWGTGIHGNQRSLSARMSCQGLPDGAAMNTDCIFGSGSSLEQICHTQSRDELSPDSAEETSDLYCKHVTLCDIIQKREASFLQRNLGYKVHANQKKRIQITLSLSGSSNPEVPAENIFPLYALFAKPIGNVLPEDEENIPIYQFSLACLLTCFGESGRNSHTEATFIIRDLKTLADLILVSCGQVGQTPDENNCSKSHMENSYLQKLGGQCFWGKIPNNLLCSSLENCVDLSLGRTKQLVLPITMNPGFIETKFLKQNCYLTFCPHKVNAMCPSQLQVSICAQQAGARDMFKSPYNSYLYSDVPLSSLPHIIRLRAGNVVFKYEKNICQEEVTEDFSCSFCLIKCGSFKGLQYHLLSSHDRFNFEFSTTPEKQVVNVSLKNNTWRNEDFPAGVDPRQRTFSYFSNKKRRRSATTTEAIVPSKVTEAIVPSKATEVIIPSKSTAIIVPTKAIEAMVPLKATETIVLTKATETIKHGHLPGTSVSDTSVDPTYSLHGNHLSSPRVLQFGKTRRLSIIQFNPRNRQLLQKRQFFHSHTGQQMTFEEVLSDHDSEDEVDDDVADFEDRRMLDDFINITKDEKCIMHMWNSFVSRQRVKADSHMPWACKAFSKHHGQLLAGCPSLLGCWRLFMVKLWNHNLLDGRTMNDCNMIIDGFKNKTLPK